MEISFGIVGRDYTNINVLAKFLIQKYSPARVNDALMGWYLELEQDTPEAVEDIRNWAIEKDVILEVEVNGKTKYYGRPEKVSRYVSNQKKKYEDGM